MESCCSYMSDGEDELQRVTSSYEEKLQKEQKSSDNEMFTLCWKMKNLTGKSVQMLMQ